MMLRALLLVALVPVLAAALPPWPPPSSNDESGDEGFQMVRMTNEEILQLKILQATRPGPVMCNPKAAKPQLCPGGIKCPQCGKSACLCPAPGPHPPPAPTPPKPTPPKPPTPPGPPAPPGACNFATGVNCWAKSPCPAGTGHVAITHGRAVGQVISDESIESLFGPWTCTDVRHLSCTSACVDLLAPVPRRLLQRHEVLPTPASGEYSTPVHHL